MRDFIVYQTFCVHKNHQNSKSNRYSEDKIDIRQTGNIETNSEI